MLCRAKNSGVARARGGFFRDGLGAVFTELGRVPMTGVGIRPGTAHAVEAFGLIELEQRTRGPPRPHLLHDRFSATATPGIPAAWSFGSDMPILASSASRNLRICPPSLHGFASHAQSSVRSRTALPPFPAPLVWLPASSIMDVTEK